MSWREVAIAAAVTTLVSPFAVVLGVWLAWELAGL